MIWPQSFPSTLLFNLTPSSLFSHTHGNLPRDDVPQNNVFNSDLFLVKRAKAHSCSTGNGCREPVYGKSIVLSE
jgi:hypothetical protein